MAIENVIGNVNALNIISEIRKTESRLQQNIERISTGLRINSAKDNSGLFVLSQELDTQIRGLDRASENIQQGVNFVNVALGGVDDILEIVQDIRTKALEAANSSAGDTSLRTTLQSDIQERLAEIDKLTSTIAFNNQSLLNGTFASVVGFKPGTRNFGANVAFGPDSTNLTQNAFLKIGQVAEGSARLKSGSDTGFNTGIALQTDVAVSTAQFVDTTGPAAATTATALDSGNITINKVSVVATDVISFSGNLANGKTSFAGSLTIAAGSTVQDLLSTIQTSIDIAENIIGIDSGGGTNGLETNVTISNQGRLNFFSGARGTASEFDINFTIQNAADVTRTSFDVTREQTISNDELGNTTTDARIGNSTTAITGSTFEDGEFTIDVSSLTTAANQTVESNSAFFADAAQTTPVVAGTNVNASFLGSISLEDNDTIEINGTDPDGSTFSTEFTVGTDTGVGDGIVETFQNVIDELNNRDRSDVSTGFNQATATLTASGTIRIVDDVARTSSTDLTFTATESASSTAVTVNSTITATGTEEKANFSINGGDTITVNAGEVVTLFGDKEQSVTGVAPQVTLRAGRGFTTGSDTLVNTSDVFQGQLNGGGVVKFSNGDKQVTFFGNPATTSSTEQQQRVTLDFDSVVDITTPFTDGGDTFVLSTNARTLNFQIGSESNDEKFFTLTDLRPESLGSSADATLEDINVTTISGASAALDILDDAIDQVTQVSSQFGAFSDRLSDRANSLDFLSLNLENVRNQIISTDFAKETTELTQNTVLLEAQTAVLLQANSTSQTVFQLLIGIQ